ncbi:hypothetical protein [Dactylosporangium darangshiense]|uniref:hypothetical protein n=1 Tax=Dactylosporangium darangshiense TaxID=579108 RepID=UPI0031E5A1B7
MLAVAGGSILATSRSPSVEDRIDNAIDAVAKARGARLEMMFTDKTGATVDADLTFTADGYGSGTITDPGGGRAELRTSNLHTAVNGDATWWARRDPNHMSTLAGRWVQPKKGVALPVNPGLSLTPKMLALSLDEATSGITPNVVDTVTWHGQNVDILEFRDRTVALTKTDAARGPRVDGGECSGIPVMAVRRERDHLLARRVRRSTGADAGAVPGCLGGALSGGRDDLDGSAAPAGRSGQGALRALMPLCRCSRQVRDGRHRLLPGPRRPGRSNE